ncbi:MAG: hypothetical protein ACYS47_10730 [Planctomycetota bacterium]|jgi:hypothetical protein
MGTTMALRTCPECESEASTKVPACIRCGHRFERHGFYLPKNGWDFLIESSMSFLIFGTFVAALGAYFLWAMEPPHVGALVLAVGGLVFWGSVIAYLYGRAVQRRGEHPCQSCGNRNTRSFRDEGKTFSVCGECMDELNST